MSNPSQNDFIPSKERKTLRDKKIRALYQTGLYSMDDVVIEMGRLGHGVSKTTVFFAINGRWTKKAADRRRSKKRFKKLLR